MPVQRRVFRIEERSRLGARPAVSTDQTEAALRHHEYIAEIKALRALIEPRVETDRESIERARAQIAEAQAYKHELGLIYGALKRTRQEIGELDEETAGAGRIVRAGRELDAVVAGTEQATQAVLQATEDIDQTVRTLASVVTKDHEQALAKDIQDRVVQIYEACKFQDLTGQRITKVQELLAFLEDHVARLMQIWHGIEEFKPVRFEDQAAADRRLLNGPKLADDVGHSSQDEIDTMFGRA